MLWAMGEHFIFQVMSGDKNKYCHSWLRPAPWLFISNAVNIKPTKSTVSTVSLISSPLAADSHITGKIMYSQLITFPWEGKHSTPSSTLPAPNTFPLLWGREVSDLTSEFGRGKWDCVA